MPPDFALSCDICVMSVGEGLPDCLMTPAAPDSTPSIRQLRVLLWGQTGRQAGRDTRGSSVSIQYACFVACATTHEAAVAT
jgi:hypothetical protein